MITLEQVLGFAIKDPTVMDQLGEALRNDLVVANSYYRRIAEFADDFLMQRRKLPGDLDWQMWLEGLEAGMIRDGTKEALGRLLAQNVSGADASFFCSQAIEHLQKGAAQVARSRLNELGQVEPAAFTLLAEKVASVKAGNVQGLARLADVDAWARPIREDDLMSTGFPLLDKLIGGWGKELVIIFADSGVGKSMLLQNCATNVATQGKRILHVTLELGISPQIRRYYRQIAQVDQGEFARSEKEVKARLRHWFRLAKGEVYLLEFPFEGLDPDGLARTIERVNRTVGQIDLVILDYLDLMSVAKQSRGRGAYEDLGRLTHGVRSLCGQFDVTVLTASQAVRRPEKKGRLSLRDMGDSYNKVRGADILIALNQTDDEEEMHQGRLGLLKVRDSGGRGKEIALYINRELAVIQELDHPNTRQLMERLGHSPTSKVTTLTPATSLSQGGLV